MMPERKINAKLPITIKTTVVLLAESGQERLLSQDT
jgi:hypothetical protein